MASEKTVGERIVDAFQFIDEPDRSFRALAASIDTARQSAFDAGLEAGAKVAETKYVPTEYGRWDTGYVNAGIGIAAAIRSQKTKQIEPPLKLA